MTMWDVIVCGGGPAGVTAALAAARNGAHTLLIERYGFLGGSSTASLVYPWMSFHNRRGDQVIGGIAQEIVDALRSLGASPGHLRDTIGFVHTLTPYDGEVYKYLVDELLHQAGVETLFHTQLIGVGAKNGHIEEVKIWNKDGVRNLIAKIFIDSTGDGDLSVMAGVPYITGRKSDGRTQPMTMNFVMGDVDLEAVKSYIQAHPEEFHPGSLVSELDHLPLTGVSGFFRHWQKYGPPEIPRDRMLFFAGIHPGQVNINTTRIVNSDGTQAADLAFAEREGRRQVQLLVEFCRQYLPGFQNAYLAYTAAQIGVRETRHITGQYVLTAEDVINAQRFPDGIAHSGYPLDIHDPSGSSLESEQIHNGAAYDIPYRCLLPLNIDNLLVNGRCISVTHTAFSSTRLTPSCMAVGQAAGLASALCIAQQLLPADLDVASLREHLRNQGAILP